MSMKRICVVGLGYIGLPTAAMLAASGFKVFGYDIDREVLEQVAQKKAPFFEPGLDQLLKRVVENNLLTLTDIPVKADVYLICVPTPITPAGQDHIPDLSYVLTAIESVADTLENGNLVLIESTCPVGTTERLHQIITEKRPELATVRFAYCPERVFPGQTLKELVTNDRVVGGLNDDASKAAKEFYESFVSGQVYCTSARTAELCKLAENSYRDVNIAFANELSTIASEYSVDVRELLKQTNRHPRVNILEPSVGVGGHCIPVDPGF